METILQNLKSKIAIIYLLGFIFALQGAIPAYINSSFLTTFISEETVGLIYILSSTCGLLSLLLAPWLLRKFTGQRVALTAAGLQIVCLFGLSFFQTREIIFGLFCLSSVAGATLAYTLDLFLESLSQNKQTGGIRGVYLTFINLAWLASPFLGTLVLGDNFFWRIYFVSGLIMLPVFFSVLYGLKGFSVGQAEVNSLWSGFMKVLANKNIRYIFGVNFLLQLFYSWMIIYTPIYLHVNIGLPWPTIGLIFTIMLVPFVIFDIPLGKVADKWLGEKEILTFGLLLTGFSTLAISFLTDQIIWLWTLILLLTRIGASATEIMSETYFWKKINETNTEIVSFYRILGPLSFIVGPALASILFYFGLDFKYLFVVLGFSMLLGLNFSFRLKDTK